MAFLNAGLKIVFRDDRVTSPVEAEFQYDGGFETVRHLNDAKDPLSKMSDT